MASDIGTVRMSAAAWSLSWDEARARQVLGELAAGPGPAAVDAKWRLREFDEAAWARPGSRDAARPPRPEAPSGAG